jgi:hypothetical protein
VVCGAKPLGSCSLLWSSVVDLILIYIFTRTFASACPPYRLCTPFRMPFACPLSIRQSTHHPERPSGPVYSASFVFQFLPPPAPRTLSSKKLSDSPHLSGVLFCVRVNQPGPRMPASLHLVFEALTCTSKSCRTRRKSHTPVPFSRPPPTVSSPYTRSPLLEDFENDDIAWAIAPWACGRWGFFLFPNIFERPLDTYSCRGY